MPSRKKKISTWPTFIKIIVDILHDEQSSEALHWSEDGESIVMKDTTILVNQTLPKYFKHGNLSSFIRQLNMYNFKKISAQSSVSIYLHPHFRRGRESQYRRIKRKARKASEDSEEIKLPEKKSINKMKDKMLKLSQKEKKLQLQNDQLLHEKNQLLRIKQEQQKQYQRFLNELNNKNAFLSKFKSFKQKTEEEMQKLEEKDKKNMESSNKEDEKLNFQAFIQSFTKK